MAQIGLPQALGLGPGIALFPASISSGLSSSLNILNSDQPSHNVSTTVGLGDVLSAPPRGDICHRYGMEFMLLQRFYQNPDLWNELKTKFEERQKRRKLKKLRKRAAAKSDLKKKEPEDLLKKAENSNHPKHQKELTERKSKDSSTTYQVSSEDENDEEEEKNQSHSGHSFIILNSRTGTTQTVIQGPITSKVNATKERLNTSLMKNFAEHPVKSQDELDLFHCLRDLDTTWSWILWSSKDHWNAEFLSFLLEEIEVDHTCKLRGRSENIISSYLNRHQFTELYLDGINSNGFRSGGNNRQSAQFDAGLGFGPNAATVWQVPPNAAGLNNPSRFPQSFLAASSGGIPPEIFRCSQVRILSLRSNHLDILPADIGRMQKLEYLALTNNRLQNSSIPYTLSFCTKLKTLLLDDNLLDALPGFLLKMHSLETVHRHGNHNYFKATFMWYHTDVNERILSTYEESGGVTVTHPPVNNNPPHPTSLIFSPEPLNFLAAKSLLGHKINFFLAEELAPPMKDFIVDIYERFDFEVCENCCTAKVMPSLGFKVITFKNPYLGNTCVPFQHWACSMECAKAIEEPARLEQVSAAAHLDRLYDSEVRLAQDEFTHRHHRSPGGRRFGRRRRRDHDDCAAVTIVRANNPLDSRIFLHRSETDLRPNTACCILM